MNILNASKKRRIQNAVSRLCYRQYRKASLRYGLNVSEPREKKIILSLTSFGSRLSEVDVCIRSLLSQTMKPDAVLLYLDCNTSREGVPKKLTDLEQYGLTIIYDCEDLKPHKKYFFARQNYPDDLLITVDDDVIYERTLVEDLFNAYTLHPDCVISKRARVIQLREQHLLPYQQWPLEKKHYGSSSSRFLATGVGGVLYPPHVLPEETFDKAAFSEICLYADDLWLKAAELKSGVKTVCIKPRFPFLLHLPEHDAPQLHMENLLNNRNDKYIQNAVTFFSLGIEHLDR